MNDELARMADYIIHEFLRWERKEPLQNQVTLDMLATLGWQNVIHHVENQVFDQLVSL